MCTGHRSSLFKLYFAYKNLCLCLYHSFSMGYNVSVREKVDVYILKNQKISMTKLRSVSKVLICLGIGAFFINAGACSFSDLNSGSQQQTINHTVKESDLQTDSSLTESGQENRTEQAEEEPDNREAAMAEEVNPQKKPPVLIARSGYALGDDKLVYYQGGEEARIFYVVDEKTRETVYSGKGNKHRGDFSLFDKEGSYYIEVPDIGRSYSFQIKEDALVDFRKELMDALWKEAETSDGIFLYKTQTLSWLLRYQEFYGEEPDSILSGPMPKVTKQAQKLGEILIEKKEETMDVLECSYYGAAMAQLYEVVKPYDTGAANRYLREAEDAYSQLEKNRLQENFDETWLFYDAALLYRATGYSKYANAAKTYLKEQSDRSLLKENADEEQILSDEAYIYGVVAYLTTVRNVDVDLCGVYMEKLMDEARSIAEEYETHPYRCVSSDLRNRLLSDKLYLIAVMEHTIVSREYVQILKNGIRYIDGCNESGGRFLTDRGIFDPKKDEKYSDAALGGAYLFIMGEIMESEAEK